MSEADDELVPCGDCGEPTPAYMKSEDGTARCYSCLQLLLYRVDPEFRRAIDTMDSFFTHEVDTVTGVELPMHQERDRN